MGKAIIKLMKVETANLAAFYQCGCDHTVVVDNSLENASFKIHEKARKEIE